MYKDLETFRVAKEAARLERDVYARALGTRWDHLQDARTRGLLLRDAVGDALMSWKPFERVHALLHGRVSGDMVASLGMTAAGFSRSWTKRLLYSGAAMLAGKLMGSNGVPEGEGLLTSTIRGIGSLIGGLRQRKSRRKAAAVEDDE